tara:strand:- start:1766 stop:1975 length:210 start_codon:yes stop_codon:yes gene_type:complete
MFKAEIQVVNDSKWYGNDLEFKFKSEAEVYAKDLFQRWTQSVDWRTVEVFDWSKLSQKQQSQLRSYNNN